METRSPTQLAREFGVRFPSQRVSAQAVRKWLNGEAMPSLGKLNALAGWLGVSVSWLQYGTGAGAYKVQQTVQPYLIELSDQELLKRYHRLTRSQQHAVAEIITAMVGKSRKKT